MLHVNNMQFPQSSIQQVLSQRFLCPALAPAVVPAVWHLSCPASHQIALLLKRHR